MKNILNKILAISLLTLGIGCSDYVEEINTDPNAFLDAPAENMLQGVMISNQFWQNGTAARLAMIWMNQATGSDRQYIALNDWNSSSAPDFNNPWGEAFAGTIAQAQIARGKSIEANNFKLAGVLQVLEAQSLGMATSLWGDIPYAEANNVSEFPNPQYDLQTSVYDAAQNLLDEAIDNLGKSGTIPNDLYFDGNETNWIALAHAMKARFYLHIGDYENASIQSQMGIANPEGDFIAQFGSNFGLNFNPYYSFTVYDRNGYMSADDSYGAKLLDPTSSIYRGNSKTDESGRFNFTYLDNENIYNSGYEINFTNLFDGWGAEGKFGEDIPLVTYGEMLLIQAEYETRINGVSAGVNAYNTFRQLLNSGYSINLNTYGGGAIKYEDYEVSDFESGGMENPDSIDSKEALLREIIEERYVYFIGHFESFNDYKRTGNKANIVLKSGFSGTPQRFIYPQSEINSNTSIPSPLPSVIDPTPINL